MRINFVLELVQRFKQNMKAEQLNQLIKNKGISYSHIAKNMPLLPRTNKKPTVQYIRLILLGQRKPKNLKHYLSTIKSIVK